MDLELFPMPSHGETNQHQQLAAAVWRRLGSWRRFVIAIDGLGGAGKSTQARYLGWKLGIAVVETDLFFDDSGVGLTYRDDELGRAVARRLEFKRPVIVEGVAALDLCVRLSLGSVDFHVRIESALISASPWYDQNVPGYFDRHPSESADFLFTVSADE